MRVLPRLTAGSMALAGVRHRQGRVEHAGRVSPASWHSGCSQAARAGDRELRGWATAGQRVEQIQRVFGRLVLMPEPSTALSERRQLA